MNRPAAAEPPWLAVLMPLHDGARWIKPTLESLIGEANDGVEIIAVDSSPDDACARMVERFADRLKIKLVRRPDIVSWTAKTNLALEMASAEHACMLHQDDLWLPGRTAAIRRWIADAPDAVLHLAPTAIVDAGGRRVGTWRCPLPAETALPPRMLVERLLVQNFVSVPGPVFRRDAWIGCGGMDPELWYTCDWDIWLKLSQCGDVRYHDEPTTSFRVHGSSLTMTGCRQADDFEAQMRVVLERHLAIVAPRRASSVERRARASIRVNVALAQASRGEVRRLAGAVGSLLRLGPVGLIRYLRDSRILERVFPRLRARIAGGP